MKEYHRTDDGLVTLFTIPEVAEVCRVTPWTVKNWIHAKKLRAIRLGGPRVIRIPGDALLELLGEKSSHQQRRKD
jgi:excisionase family DNA binding protein